MTQRRPAIIGVMGGSQVSAEIAALAEELGRALAEQRWVVLSGGRDTGVMAAVSAGAARAGGTTVGILPDADLAAASPHLTIPIRTGLGQGRNLLNVLSSDVVVALPGGTGTLTEIALALKNQKPIYLLGWGTRADSLQKIFGLLRCYEQVPELVGQIKAQLPELTDLP